MLRARLLTVVTVIFLIVLTILGTQVKNGAYGNQAPFASFTYSPRIPAPEQIITFDASASYDLDGWITQYSWNFGDGNVTTVTYSTMTHAYPIDGNYTVELTVTDNSQAVGVACAIVEASTEVYFRVCFYGTLIPMSNVEVTMYYKSGIAWIKAPVGTDDLEIRYDNMTQPDLAGTPEERFRNPGFTASILRANASNVGFDIHPSYWKVFFKFKWGETITYWPNHTTRVYTYDHGVADAHDYSQWNDAEWDPTAGTYVITAKDIPKNGVSPCQNNPIIVGILCPPPRPKYYLTVRTDPSSIATIPGQGWYLAGTNATLNAPGYVNVSTDTRYRFSYWDVDGTPRSAGVNPITVTMNANHTATAHYVQQSSVTFTQSGLTADATGTVVIVDSASKTLGDLPFTKWVDSGSYVTYSHASPVSSTIAGKRYRLSSVTGPSSPITVTGAVTVTGNYVTQYLVVFPQTGLDSTALGTVVTVNTVAKTYADLPYFEWFDAGASVTYSYSSIVSSTVADKRFRLVAVHSPSSPFTVTGPVTITGEYSNQYQITFTQSGLDSTATGAVVTVNEDAKLYTDLPYSFWVDSGSSVTYSYTPSVSSSAPGKRFRLTSVTGPASPITVTAPTTVTGNYIAQYLLTFTQNGLDSTATGTVVTVNGTAKTYAQLPYTLWVDSGISVAYSYSSTVTSSVSGKRFRFDSVSGPASPITVTGSATVTGCYVTQYSVTFDQTGLGSSATGTVVTVNGNARTLSQLPYAFWVDGGSTVTYSYTSIVSSSIGGQRYRLDSITGPTSPITVASATTVTGNYVTQFSVTFAQTGLDSTATGTVVTVNGGSKIYSELPSIIWVDSGSSVTYSYSSTVTSSVADKRFRLGSVTGPSSPITVTGSTTVTGNYVTQYSVTFTHAGLDSTATGTVVTVNDSPKIFTDLPYSVWVDSGGSVTYSYDSPVAGSVAGKRFRLSGVTGPASPITVTGSATVIGNYVVQYSVTFAHTGLDSTATGTVVMVNGVGKVYADLPYSAWFDSGVSVTYSYNSTVSSTVTGERFRLVAVHSPTSPFIVTDPVTITGEYCKQYRVTFAQSGLDSTATGTVVTVNGNAKLYTDLPFSFWVDSGSSVTYSYNDVVLSSTSGKRFKLVSVTGSASPITVTSPTTVTGNYKTQYQVMFDQSGVGTDFTGTVVTIDGYNYGVSGLLTPPFWWDQGSSHSFAFASPLVVNATKQYVWTSTSGLSNLQSGTLTISTSGSVVGNYAVQNWITFDQLGASSDFTGTIVIVDGTPYSISQLPKSFYWQVGTNHTFAFQSPLVVAANTKQYVWTSTTGLSALQSGTITVTAYGTIVGNYKTQYYLTLATNPSGVTSPSGTGWYDANSYATISTASTVDIIQGSSRYKFSSWATTDMAEIADPSATTTMVLMDKDKTVTANYATQYSVTFGQSGVGSDFAGTVVTVDGVGYARGSLSVSFWWDSGSSHAFAFSSPLIVAANNKQYVWTSTTGLSTLQSGTIVISGSGSVTGNYKTQYYLTVTSPYGTTGGQGWYDSGETAHATLNTGTVDHGNGTQHVFTDWNGDASGTNYAQSDPITMNGPKAAVVDWKTQYYVTFTHLGLDSSASGTVVIANSVPKTYIDLPYGFWVDSGGSVTYSYNNVSSSTTGKKFILMGVTGLPSPITVTNPVTVTGNYKTQYQVTFGQSGVGSDFAGTVVTVDGVGYARGSLSVSFWWDSGSSHAFAFSSPLIVAANNKQYVWTSTTGLSASQSGTITVSGSGSVTANYKTQYYLTVASLYGISGGGGWYDSGDTAFATLNTGTVLHPNGTQHVFTNWNADASGTNYVQSNPITMSGPKTASTRWKTQYQITFDQNGLDSSASGTVVIVNGSPKTYSELAYSIWVDSGGSVTYSYANVSSSTSGKRFILTGVSGPVSPFTVTGPQSIVGDYKTQYQITFSQSGVGSDFAGTVVTIDSTAYARTSLPVSLWFDIGSTRSFAFSSPLIVNASRQYIWNSTTGLSSLQSGNLAVAGSGSLAGNYVVHLKYLITFSQSGVDPDFPGSVVVIDGSSYGYSGLSTSFWWDSGSSHTFAFQSPLIVAANLKRYVWTNTTGLSTLQSGTITVSGSGNVWGHYKTQYYLTLDTNPLGVDSPSGEGWYDAGTLATISTDAFVDIVPGYSRYRFNGWTTSDMPEIVDPSRSPTAVLMDKGKTVTANYATQYAVVFDQTGVDSDFLDTVVLVDSSSYTVSNLPTPAFWWDKNSVHTFAFQSPLVVTANAKQYNWTSTTGLSTAKSGSLTVTTFGSVIGNYRTRYYLTVNSLYDSPDPMSRWYDAGTSITASVTSPASGSAGTRYLCTGWTGTGSVPVSGTATSVAFTINAASSIAWNWKTQYSLTVGTIPVGITTIPGQGWYDALTSVTLTAPPVTNYTFNHWKVDGISRGTGVNPIMVTMDAAHTATAYYEKTYLPLSVTISPMVSDIYLHDSVWFVATVSGGTSPYSYQWYVNGNLVSGATGSTWSFTPSSTETYFVYVKITDANGNTTQSDNARVTVRERPQGGYSISLTKPIAVIPLVGYAIAMVVFCVATSLFRRKRK